MPRISNPMRKIRAIDVKLILLGFDLILNDLM
jgi:hypothetical protein